MAVAFSLDRGLAMNRVISLAVSVMLSSSALAADENDYWTIRTLPEPEGVHLEVGGILPLGGGEIPDPRRFPVTLADLDVF